MKELRKIEKSDLEIIFQWRNHPVTRGNSFNKSHIPLDTHKSWFEKALKSDLIIGYIFEVDQIPVGTIRFDISEENKAEVNYLIAPSFQGKGFGTEILQFGVENIFNERPEVKSVYGQVLKENNVSKHIFEKLSFNLIDLKDDKLIFEKKKDEN